jgi:hypothetical protein
MKLHEFLEVKKKKDDKAIKEKERQMKVKEREELEKKQRDLYFVTLDRKRRSVFGNT